MKSMGISRKELGMLLSRLDVFTSPSAAGEQYPTDPEVAATVLWRAYMQGDIRGRKVADLGAGTGMLGIGCILLGARLVLFVEKDPDAVKVLRKNLAFLSEIAGPAGTGEAGYGHEVILSGVEYFSRRADTIVQNPPFGTRQRHLDALFLSKAMSAGRAVYSLHKSATAGFIQSLAQECGFSLEERLDFSFPLKKTMRQHRKPVKSIRVSCFCLRRSYRP